jgi:hypothetical protein
MSIVLVLGISGLLLWLIWWRLDSDGKSAGSERGNRATR